jgi:rhomboid family protein
VIPLKDNVPTRSFPIFTVLLIVINVVIYFGVEQGGLGLGSKGNERVLEYGAIPYEVTHPGKQCFQPTPQALACGREGEPVLTPDGVPVGRIPTDQPPTWLTLISSMFLHGSLLHLAGNMLFLWIFGNNIEDSMSKWRFPIFYVLGGAAALAAQILVAPNAHVPTVGASGAIAAVLGGYAILYPRARVVTLILIIFFFTIVELPALLVLGLWFLLQLLYGAAQVAQPLGDAGGGVAYFAHIGGFAFGLLLIKLFANRVNEDYDAPRRLPVY